MVLQKTEIFNLKFEDFLDPPFKKIWNIKIFMIVYVEKDLNKHSHINVDVVDVKYHLFPQETHCYPDNLIFIWGIPSGKKYAFL